MTTTPVSLPTGTPIFQASLAAPSGPINIRNAPSTNASVVGSITSGPKVMEFAEPANYGDWYWISTGAVSGWISKLRGYPTPVRLSLATTQPTPPAISGLTASELEMLAVHFGDIAGIFQKAADREQRI